MKVFKFGGASVKDAASVRNVFSILTKYENDELFVVISAMGKTTSKLEELVEYWYNGSEKTIEVFNSIKHFHLNILFDLMPDNMKAHQKVTDIFNTLQNEIQKKPTGEYDRFYDKIVSYGELFSTTIIDIYLQMMKLNVEFLDARELIITDDTWREARIDWEITGKLIRNSYEKIKGKIGLTQGFIGSTTDDYPVTLGLEGSDFTASIFAYVLDAEEVVVWKDVPGLMNADPKQFDNTTKLEVISYHEAIELAYYGAKVIHPKCIKPLQNKKIPLKIKSFLNPETDGSLIQSLEKYDQMIPSFIIKEKQLLISLSAKDFAFISEKHLSRIFLLLSEHNTRVNLMQNSAISFSLCIDDKGESAVQLIENLRKEFDLRFNSNLELITIRHFSNESIDKLLIGKEVLLEQRSRNTVQFVVKD